MRTNLRILSGIILLVVIIVAGVRSCSSVYEERNNAGIDYTNSAEYPLAIAAYEEAIVLDPNSPIAYFNSSNAYYRGTSLQQAVDALEQAVVRGDETMQAQAWYNLGNLYFMEEFCEEALAAYRSALAIDPTYEDARFNLELVSGCIPTPTPTPQEMQVELTEESVNPSVTPTPVPSGEELPTPTPTPPEEIPPPDEDAEPTPLTDEEGDAIDEPQPTVEPNEFEDIDVEDALDLLEPVKANQENLSTFRTDYNLQPTPDANNIKDW